VAQLQACLVDAYDTIVTCDFSVLRREMAALAEVTEETWQQHYGQLSPLLSDGRMSKAQAFGQLLRMLGRPPRAELVREMVRVDQELLLANTRLFDDALPFLDSLRARGVMVAIVSNCTENTRPTLVALGVDTRADALVLSCEVGSAKPKAEIFRYALGRLGVPARAAVFVDDQAGYCAGSVALGINTVQIVRGELDGKAPAAGSTVVRSLPEVEAMFPG